MSKKPRVRERLPATFEPQFWAEADGRSIVVKEVRRRYERLKNDADADSTQKDLLVQRAVFISLQLESMEIAAAETGKLDSGIYTQMANSLLGLLKALGLEKKNSKVVNLRSYMQEQDEESEP